MFHGVQRSNMFHYDWQHPLTWIAAIALLGSLLAIAVSAFVPSIAILSNIVTLIASSLISHLITYSNERKQFSRHLAKFSAFAKRRVELLCTDLNRLSIEISDTADLKEAKRIVIYALKNLEQDAKASVQDIDDMRRIDEEDAIAVSEHVTAVSSIAERETDAATLLPPAKTEAEVIYCCTNCGYENTALLSTAQGETRQSQCANCRTGHSLNRLANGAYAVSLWRPAPLPVQPEEKVIYSCNNCGYENTGLLSSTQGATRQSECANCRTKHLLHRLARGEYRVINPMSKAAARADDAPIQDSFSCPRCQHRIRFTTPPDQRVIQRPCFSCLSVISFDRPSRVATLLADRKPIYLETLDDAKKMECLNCHQEFITKVYRAKDGKQLVCCFFCNTLYLPRKYRQTTVTKACPSEGCGNHITFKIHEMDSEARHFCFECMSRLIYRRASDEANVIEKLTVPQTTIEDFSTNGRLCPHCHGPSSGRYLLNSRKQKLHICWHCKNVFELVEGSTIVPLHRTGSR